VHAPYTLAEFGHRKLGCGSIIPLYSRRRAKRAATHVFTAEPVSFISVTVGHKCKQVSAVTPPGTKLRVYFGEHWGQ